MSTDADPAKNRPLPSPLPEGWYLVASRQDVLKAKLIQRTWMGESVVVWCDEHGRVCVAESFCAHLGSDLGPAAGGRTSGGRLVCPFHSYDNVNRVGPVSVDGPRMRSGFDFRTTRAMARIATITIDFSVTSPVFGLGYSFVDFREHSIGMDMRLWVLATPVDGTLIDFSLVSQIRELRSARRRIAGLAWLPPRLRAPIINKLAIYFQLHDVWQDVVIGSRKRYRSNPRLCRSDGEIMAYRADCAQVYPDPHASARTRSVAAAVKHTASRSRQRAPALGIPEVQSASQASSGNQHTP